MSIAAVLAQHADEAAFLWTMRTRAVRDPLSTLDDLSAWDARLEAHLQGLRVAGPDAWRFCEANLAEEAPGAVFVLGVLAFEAGDRARMLQALDVGCASSDTLGGLVAALGWLDGHPGSRWIQPLLQARSAVHRRIGLAARAIRREDAGPALVAGMEDPEPSLRARALRAAGELCRRDVGPLVARALEDEDETCRFWAAWSLALLREPGGVKALRPWMPRDDGWGGRAVALGIRALPYDEARHVIRGFAKDPAHVRTAVAGSGALGDPAVVPWLITMMASAPLARVAGEAFTLITGLDLEAEGLTAPAPAVGGGEDDAPAGADPDALLPTPDAAAVSAWWRRHGDRFGRDERYLAGRVLGFDTARDVLASGTQTQRAAAALEIALRGEPDVLFEVRARGALQRRRLQAADLGSRRRAG